MDQSPYRPWYAFQWPDSRGWVGFGVFAMSVMLLWMMKEDRVLREDEFFQTIATVIISNGLMAVVAWAFSATKGGGELADKNAAIVDRVANHVAVPAEVTVTNTPENPVNTSEGAPADGELPEDQKL